MTGAIRAICVCLMLGLVLPVCVKAFAPAASASTSVLAPQDDGPKTPSNLPCLTCCGGWMALLAPVIVPEQRRDDMAVTAKPDTKPLSHVSAAIAAQDPPRDWRLTRGLPHSYAHMHARTERLLL